MNLSFEAALQQHPVNALHDKIYQDIPYLPTLANNVENNIRHPEITPHQYLDALYHYMYTLTHEKGLRAHMKEYQHAIHIITALHTLYHPKTTPSIIRTPKDNNLTNLFKLDTLIHYDIPEMDIYQSNTPTITNVHDIHTICSADAFKQLPTNEKQHIIYTWLVNYPHINAKAF